MVDMLTRLIPQLAGTAQMCFTYVYEALSLPFTTTLNGGYTLEISNAFTDAVWVFEYPQNILQLGDFLELIFGANDWITSLTTIEAILAIFALTFIIATIFGIIRDLIPTN